MEENATATQRNVGNSSTNRETATINIDNGDLSLSTLSISSGTLAHLATSFNSGERTVPVERARNINSGECTSVSFEQ